MMKYRKTFFKRSQCVIKFIEVICERKLCLKVVKQGNKLYYKVGGKKYEEKEKK